ncbi:cytochrome c oxidase subunit CcoM [Pokkaliibacter sp. MBI-7]|nr:MULTISPECIES: cytochrome c oxidase subunit CcoM [Pokkaliibacter]MDH2432003.1 cytochrome c oxidase subunit CcoM [Pokkaliibacter sp. MBI-7]
MYMDTVVIAGLAVIVMALGFFGGLAYFIKKDNDHHQRPK